MSHPNIVHDEEKLAEIVRTSHTVAVVGAKDESEPDAAAYTIPRELQARGFRIIPINPRLETALGERAYPSLTALGEPVDIVDVFRRAEAVGPLADEILALPADKRPKVVWMQTGIRNEEAAERLAAAGIAVVQNHCLGVYTSRYASKPRT